MPEYPKQKRNYRVEIAGTERASFQSCSGPKGKIGFDSYNEGGYSRPLKLPGRVEYSDLELKWGMASDTELYEWYRRVSLGIVERKNLSVVITDNAGAEVARYNCYRAFPVSYEAGELDAGENGALIVSMSLAYEDFELV